MRLKDFKVLSKREIEEIYFYSKRLLSEKGILIPSNKLKEVLRKKGVKFDGFIAKFNEKIIEDSLKSAPKEIKIYNRDLEYSINIGKETKFASGHDAIYLLDKKNKKRIPIKKVEVGNFALISDYLNEIDVVGVEGYPQDVNPKSSILHGLDAVLNNTSKPVCFATENLVETIYMIKIVRTISSDFINYPIGIWYLSPHSPLAWDKSTIEALMLLAEEGFPIGIAPCPFSFVTAPITLAGEILQSITESLAALSIAQLINPGTPILFGNFNSTANIENGEFLIGTTECNLMRIAFAQIARYYDIPSVTFGPDSDSNLHDEQNGFEKISSIISAVGAGISLTVNAGMFATGLTVSYEQLIIDAELIRFTKRYIKGINVTKESLAYKSIKNVEYGKDYITDPLTLKFLRSEEHIHPIVSNRRNYDQWKKLGSPDIVENSQNMVKEILKDHKPFSLKIEKQNKIKEIIDEFESKYE